MDFLEIQGVHKQQQGNTTLHPVSFSVPQGKKLGIAGATGSGKTTLLKIIAGLMQPDGGQVVLEGKRVLGPDEKLLPGHPAIGYLSQHFELRNNYTIGEELDYANGLPQAEADAIYKICDIGHLLERGTNQVSGGEKQRIVTARVLTTRPMLLLLDEPFSNLDAGHRATMKGMIRHLTDLMDLTCIMVSHDPVDTLSWADELVVLQEGRMVQQGTPKAVYFEPVNEYVASLFGAYNLLSPAQAQLFGVKSEAPGKKLMVRPGSFVVKTTGNGGLMGKVTEQAFMGSHYEIGVALPHFSVNMLTLDGTLKPGTAVSVALQNGHGCWL